MGGFFKRKTLALVSMTALVMGATACLQQAEPDKLASKSSNLTEDEDENPPVDEGGGDSGGDSGGDPGGDWGGGDTGDTGDDQGGDPGDSGDDGDPDGGDTGDTCPDNNCSNTDDGTNQSGTGVACRAACWGAAGLGCGAVSVACAVGDVVTIGGVTIPCALAIVAACTAANAGASVCSDMCPP